MSHNYRYINNHGNDVTFTTLTPLVPGGRFETDPVGKRGYSGRVGAATAEGFETSAGSRIICLDVPAPALAPPQLPTLPVTGQKFDGGKDEPSLLMQGCNLAVAGVIAVLGFGFRKYGKRNGWKEVPDAQRRYKDALYRHLAAIERGELYDNEPGGSGKPHWDHVACNAMFLSQMHHEASDPK